MKKWLLIFLLFCSAFLRFYQLKNYAGFDFDQELAVTQAKKISQGDFTLVGQEVSVGGIFVGPFYNYVTAILLLVSQDNPAIIFYFQALLGVITTFLVYKVGEKHNFFVGIYAATLYSFSWKILYFDKTAAPSNWLLFLTALMFLVALSDRFSRNSKLLLSSSILGFASQLHPIGIVLISVPIEILKKIKSKLRLIVWSLGLFVFWFIPLLVFDLRHNFLNFNGLLARSDVFDYPFIFRLIQRLGLLVDVLFTLLSPSRSKLILITVLGIVYLGRKSLPKVSTYIGVIIVNLLVFSLYKGSVPDYYFLPSMIAFMLMVAILVFDNTKHQLSSFFIGGVLLILVVSESVMSYPTYNYVFSYQDKLAVVNQIASQSTSKPIIIHLDTDLGQGNGFTYLTAYKNLQVEFDHKNPDYEIYIPGTRTDKPGQLYGQIKLIKN